MSGNNSAAWKMREGQELEAEAAAMKVEPENCFLVPSDVPPKTYSWYSVFAWGERTAAVRNNSQLLRADLLLFCLQAE